MTSAPDRTPSLAVVIPAFRAAPTLPGVLARVRQALSGRDTAVVVVDDGSDDGTATVAAEAGATVAVNVTGSLKTAV